MSQQVPSKNEVIIECNLEIDQNNFDLIVMFFENKKQSGGGDTLSSELISGSKKLIKLVYEDSETKERILKKKFFNFKNFLLRSFDSNVNGYKFDRYNLNKTKLIIRDILIDSDLNNDDETNNSIVRLYAEHLAPDNDIFMMNKSSLFSNTFYVTYKEELDADKLKIRYNKKPKLRNKQINILDSFDTKSFIIASTTKATSLDDFDKIKLKVIEEIEKRETNPHVNYFIDINDKFILFQFENDSFLNDLIDSLRLYLKNTNNEMALEHCYNFDLLKHIPEKIEIPILEPKFEVKIKKSDSVDKNLPKLEKKPKKEKQPKPESKSQSIKSTKATPDDIQIEKIKMDHFNLNNLIKSETENDLTLNDQSPLSIGLKNCAQMRIDLDKSLKPLQTALNFSKKNKYKSLSIRVDMESKYKVIDLLKNFAKSQFMYKIVHLPKNAVNDEELMQSLIDFIPKINEQHPTVYLEVKNDLIHAYGHPNDLDQVLEKNCEILNQLIEKKSSLEEKKTVQEIIKSYEPEKQAKSSTGEIKKDQESISIKVRKEKSKTDQNSDSNVIVLFNSYQPIEGFPFETNKILQQQNVFLIDAKEFKTLSMCLSKCNQVIIDFMNDLKMISPKCSLVKIEDLEPKSNYAVLIDSTEENYISAFKDQINKLASFYEKNRLKYVFVLIDEKLKLEDAFPELISNFGAKDELNDLKIILEMIYSTDKVVHAQIVDNSLIEIYGYTNAVQNFDKYVYDILNKTITQLSNNLNNLMAFKLFLKENSKLKIFFKFDAIYFNDLAIQLSAYEAFAIKLDDQKALHIACSNKKLKNNPRKLDKIDEIKEWRKNVDKFIEEYMENFGQEFINMPFGRNSEDSKNVLYDKNSLEIAWVNDNQIEIFGLKEEIANFKNKIFNC